VNSYKKYKREIKRISKLVINCLKNYFLKFKAAKIPGISSVTLLSEIKQYKIVV